DGCRPSLRRGTPLAVVLSHRLEDVEDSAAHAVLCPGRVRDATGDLVAVAGAQAVLHAVDREQELAVDDEPELLVRVAVLGDARARLEVEQVEHRSVAEERAHAHAPRELVPRARDEIRDVRHQPAATGFGRSPIRSTDTVTSSPGFRYTGGWRKQPTPAGVPVETMSPGSSVTSAVRYSSRTGGGKIISDAGDDCIVSPFSVVETWRVLQSPISSAVTTSGPSGQNVSGPLPSVSWFSLNCTSRAETSSRIVQPKTASRAECASSPFVRRPITIASSTA